MTHSEDINNEFFVHHIDTLVITQQMYTEQEILQTYVAAWTSINLQETSARTTVTQKKNKTAQYIHYLKPDESPEKCNMIVFNTSAHINIYQAEAVCQFTANSTSANSTGWNCLPIRIKIQ